jgi:biotin carboxyl carrier protein
VTTSFEIEVNGRSRTVTVERSDQDPARSDQDPARNDPATAGRFRVNIDGRSRVVDVRRGPAGALSILFPDDGGTSYDVAVVSSGRGEVTVHLPSTSVQAAINGKRARQAGAAGAAGSTGEQRIVAPMPGRVVRVLVAPGDEVVPRQPLVVVEAMKMENELSASRVGRVKDVQASEGMPVEAGKLLVIVG